MIIGHLVAGITILIWGTTFISTKILLNDFTPIEILCMRFILGFIILCMIYPKILPLKTKKQEFIFFLAGLSGIGMYYLLENIALIYTMAANVGVIICVAPFFTAIMAHLINKQEKLSLKFFIGFFVAIIGIMCISFSRQGDITFNPFGDFLALLAAFVWAIYSILTKKIGEYGYNIIQTTRRTFVYGIICMVPTLWWSDFNVDWKICLEPINLFNLLFLSIGASALCFVTWNMAVKILGAIKTSTYIYAVPVITVITSFLILEEPITIWSAIGTFLTLVGLFISQY